MPPHIKELSTFTSATHLPLPDQFFFVSETPLQQLGCARGSASVYTSTAQPSQYGADMMLHNGQKDEHHANA